MRFQTENGSIYDLDQEKMTWKRLFASSRSDSIRAEQGELLFWPKIKVGQTALLEDKNVKGPTYLGHIVETSKVMEIFS